MGLFDFLKRSKKGNVNIPNNFNVTDEEARKESVDYASNYMSKTTFRKGNKVWTVNPVDGSIKDGDKNQ